MVNEIMKSHPNAQAKVKIQNEASRKLFEKCGFKMKYYLMEKK
jgi:RimJ/RimL family protein N-acetyltransferase